MLINTPFYEETDFKLRFALECADSINWEMNSDFSKIIFSGNFDTTYGIRQTDYDYDFDTFISLHLNPYKERIYETINKYINGETDIISIEISMRDKWGKEHWLLVRGKFINDERKLIYGVSVNITERKFLERRLAQMAYVDSITGVYRLEYIADAFAGRIESVCMSNAGLMLLNISRFRDINAVFGHERGNEVLRHAARRLAGLTDGILAKIDAGFIIAFSGDSGYEKILSAFEEPLNINGQLYHINFKIGIAPPMGVSNDFGALLKDAEIAVNHIKNDEFNNVCVIGDGIRKESADRLNITYELRQAVLNDEFALLFQPIINAATKRVSGAEALIRWKHPERGMVSPVVFIPIAEQNGLINQIGDFVLREAMKQLKKCLETDDKFYISINVSVTQLMSPDFIGRVKELMECYSIPPANLVAEVTESVFITDMKRVTGMLNSIRELGVRVSLDDFGTGYSSLSYLAKIPLDNLKIDQSFLRDALNDPTSVAILKSIISLARNLNLSITAEGVETAEHLELLEVHGCDYLQGYHFSKPIPPDELERFMKRGNA